MQQRATYDTFNMFCVAVRRTPFPYPLLGMETTVQNIKYLMKRVQNLEIKFLLHEG